MFPVTDLGICCLFRKLGATNEKVTMLGLGGSHFGRLDELTSERVIEAAIEGGIRFFDNAESYRGGAEEKYGKYLVPKYRDVSFIMTKTRAVDAKTAEEHLEQSTQKNEKQTISTCGRCTHYFQSKMPRPGLREIYLKCFPGQRKAERSGI